MFVQCALVHCSLLLFLPCCWITLDIGTMGTDAMRVLSAALRAVIMLVCPGAALAEIVIGLAAPLSGRYGLSGEVDRGTAETAVRELNDQGGVLDQKVVLISVDDACGLERSLMMARQLISAGVVAVMGHMCSHSSLLAAGLDEPADVLMITPSSTHPRLTEEGRHNDFRLIGRDDDQGRLAGDFLAEHWASKRIGLLHDSSTYGAGLAREIRRQLLPGPRSRRSTSATCPFKPAHRAIYPL